MLIVKIHLIYVYEKHRLACVRWMKFVLKLLEHVHLITCPSSFAIVTSCMF